MIGLLEKLPAGRIEVLLPLAATVSSLDELAARLTSPKPLKSEVKLSPLACPFTFPEAPQGRTPALATGVIRLRPRVPPGRS
jgi:hypothetical protein